MVSGLIWLCSASLGTWVSEKSAILVLVIGGMLIFPLTRLVLAIMGKPSALPKGHPFNALAMLVAFIVPINLPLIGAVTQANINWFYPAFMLIVGSHYLPFVHLYGMWEYCGLAGILIGCGIAVGIFLPGTFIVGGWITGVTLILFSIFVLLFYKKKKTVINEKK